VHVDLHVEDNNNHEPVDSIAIQIPEIAVQDVIDELHDPDVRPPLANVSEVSNNLNQCSGEVFAFSHVDFQDESICWIWKTKIAFVEVLKIQTRKSFVQTS
jgi:hypothetical protein